jgi:hypothetical protein
MKKPILIVPVGHVMYVLTPTLFGHSVLELGESV